MKLVGGVEDATTVGRLIDLFLEVQGHSSFHLLAPRTPLFRIPITHSTLLCAATFYLPLHPSHPCPSTSHKPCTLIPHLVVIPSSVLTSNSRVRGAHLSGGSPHYRPRTCLLAAPGPLQLSGSRPSSRRLRLRMSCASMWHSMRLSSCCYLRLQGMPQNLLTNPWKLGPFGEYPSQGSTRDVPGLG
jgi:hypothetical protein